MLKINYVLITAAYNEEKYIKNTIKSVLAQNILPVRWIIVSDGSTDLTDNIIKYYSMKHDFIEFIRIEKDIHSHNFASKAYALNEGYDQLRNYDYDFIGHLDADITFDEIHYYEIMLNKCLQNPKLGIAGGFIYEKNKGKFENRPFNTIYSVAGGVQLFRRSCYEAIGGFLPLELGGEDWYAEVVARMKGWEVESFPELRVLHHKPTLKTKGNLKEGFRQGLMDYSLGTDPVFELLKCFRRLKKISHVSYVFFRIYGFFWAFMHRVKRPVPDEFIRYLRKEQLKRLRTIFLPFFP